MFFFNTTSALSKFYYCFCLWHLSFRSCSLGRAWCESSRLGKGLCLIRRAVLSTVEASCTAAAMPTVLLIGLLFRSRRGHWIKALGAPPACLESGGRTELVHSEGQVLPARARFILGVAHIWESFELKRIWTQGDRCCLPCLIIHFGRERSIFSPGRLSLWTRSSLPPRLVSRHPRVSSSGLPGSIQGE